MDFDYNVMMLIQSIHSFGGCISDAVFLIFTFLGEKTFIILIISGLYWGKNKKLGEYIIISMFASLGVNGLLKDSIRRIRPFMNPRYSNMRYVKINTPFVNTEQMIESFSFPSAHSQSSTNLFINIALKYKKMLITIVCISMILLVMMSRVYLGMHYPSDVFAGMLISLIITSIVYELLNKYYDKKILIFSIALIISSISLFLKPSSDTIKTIGFGLGALIGLIFENKYINVNETKKFYEMVRRLFLGLILLLILKEVLKLLFPMLLIFDFIRYFILGISAICFIPYLFKKIKI